MTDQFHPQSAGGREPAASGRPAPRRSNRRQPRRVRSRWPRILMGLVLVLAVLGCAGLAIFNYLLYGVLLPVGSDQNAYFYTGSTRGLYVTTGENGDFPSQDGLGAEELKAELDAIVAFAKEKGFSSIFFEARPDSTTFYRSSSFPTNPMIAGDEGGFLLFDPLKYLSAAAAEEEIELYGVVNGFYAGDRSAVHSKDNPASTLLTQTITYQDQVYFNPTSAEVQNLVASSCEELTDKYNLTGVILAGVDNPALTGLEGYDNAILSTIRLAEASLGRSGSSVRFGIMLDSQASTAQSAQRAKDWVSQVSVDLLIPRFSSGAEGSGEEYLQEIDQWSSALEGASAGVELLSCASVEGISSSNMADLGYRLFLNSMSSAVSGTVLESYSQLAADLEVTASAMSYLWDSNASLPTLEIETPQVLEIAYPDGGRDTTYTDQYYITGHSDPSQPLLMDGEELTRLSTNGTFGVLVDTPEGENTFTFQQGEETVTVTVNHPSATDEPTPISSILSSSLFPTFDYGVYAGEELTISCTAPAGATVTAQLNGTLYPLTQEVPTAQEGIAAVYSTTITVPDTGSPTETVNLGPITYVLGYNGQNTSYRSSGSVYAAGEEARLAVEINTFLTASYSEATGYDQTLSEPKNGARDYVVGLEGSRYQLESIGYVGVEWVHFLEGEVDLTSHIVDIRFSDDENGETLTLLGSSPNTYQAQVTEDALIVTFYNTYVDNPNLNFYTSQLFDQSTVVNNEDGSATFTFHFAPDSAFWGYDVSYDENDYTVLYCQKAPSLSSTFGRPLEGVSVVLDPGHDGGSMDALENYDPGALGVGGVTGAYESRLNFAVAAVLRYRLEQLGATVTYTRDNTDGEKLSLQERLQVAWVEKPDFFISVHHNSSALNVDANLLSGTEVYYSNPLSVSFAQNITDQFNEQQVRQAADPLDWAFLVTRNRFCPSVLVEVGYMSNPVEHENCSNPVTIFQEACALADAVVETVAAAPAQGDASSQSVSQSEASSAQ